MRFPKTPPSAEPILDSLETSQYRRLSLLAWADLQDGEYLHWDKLRHRPAPEGFTKEQWWAGTKAIRQKTPVRRMSEAFDLPFGYTDHPAIRESLHRFDRANVAQVLVDALGDPHATIEYRVRQLIEEAISSSLIEGARPTTRDIARQMVREGREPASKDERMIMNNWRAMERVVALVKAGNPLQLDDVLELHSIIGEGALDVEGAEGQLRQPHHQVEVADLEGNVWHTPPPAGGLVNRMEALLAFLNDDGQPFLHPVLRSIIAHFWVGFEHPFRDGNGRMARAIYYWCMLRHGYEMAEFLSISGPIDRKPTAYFRAFAYVETDEFDLTYFILHQLGVMHAAMEELVAHLERRGERTKLLASLVADYGDLNHRQRSLLNHAIRHPTSSYTIEGHKASHKVHYLTARSDLANLVERGLLHDSGGRPKRYTLPQEFVTRLQESNA